jgi:hypothetical protein
MIIPGWNEIGLAITPILQYPALSAAANDPPGNPGSRIQCLISLLPPSLQAFAPQHKP